MRALSVWGRNSEEGESGTESNQTETKKGLNRGDRTNRHAIKGNYKLEFKLLMQQKLIKLTEN